MSKLLVLAFALVLQVAFGAIKIGPYLQTPTATSAAVRWYTDSAASGSVECNGKKFDGKTSSTVFGGYTRYEAVVTGLSAGKSYKYTLTAAGWCWCFNVFHTSMACNCKLQSC